jgi:hypothetical protein
MASSTTSSLQFVELDRSTYSHLSTNDVNHVPARARTQAQLIPTNFAADDSQAERHTSGLSSLLTTRTDATEQTTVPKEPPKSCNRNSKHTIVQGQHSERSKKVSHQIRQRGFATGMMTRKTPDLKIKITVIATAASVKTPIQCKHHSSLFCSDSV